MQIQLACCTETLMQDINNPKCKQMNVAKVYAMALRSDEETDWETVNRAIIERWSRAGLERIKVAAWSGKCLEERKGGKIN